MFNLKDFKMKNKPKVQQQPKPNFQGGFMGRVKERMDRIQQAPKQEARPINEVIQPINQVNQTEEQPAQDTQQQAQQAPANPRFSNLGGMLGIKPAQQAPVNNAVNPQQPKPNWIKATIPGAIQNTMNQIQPQQQAAQPQVDNKLKEMETQINDLKKNQPTDINKKVVGLAKRVNGRLF